MSLPEFDETQYIQNGLYIKQFGYEIEGYFNSSFNESTSSDLDCECSQEMIDDGQCTCEDDNNEYNNKYFKRDGSVHCDRTYTGREHLTNGEIASCVFRIDRTEQLKAFIPSQMPNYVDWSCGIHVSVSTNTYGTSNDLAYAKLMDSNFFSLFRREVKKFMNSREINLETGYSRPVFSTKTRRLFRDRFNGIRDTYCKPYACPDAQTNHSWNRIFPNQHGRYNCMSYPYNNHGRLECRIFPSTNNPHEVELMVLWFVDFCNSYLKNCTLHENPRIQRIEADLEHENIIEEIII